MSMPNADWIGASFAAPDYVPMLTDEEEEVLRGFSYWVPCFCIIPRRLIDGTWGWGRLEWSIRQTPKSDMVGYVEAHEIPTEIYRKPRVR